jgi:hypothetical protein
MKKYLVIGEYVRSKVDGDMHYVSAPELARLYGVNPEECIFDRSEYFNKGFRKGCENLIVLRPRYDGKYRLPE